MPLTLLEPVFGRFQDRCFDVGSKVNQASMQLAMEVMIAAADVVPKEEDLAAILRELYGDFFTPGEKMSTASTSKTGTKGLYCSTDGTILATPFNCFALNQEVKITGGSEPQFQNDCCVISAALNSKAQLPAALFGEEGVPLLPCFQLDVHNGRLLVIRGCVVTPPCFQSEVLAVASLVGPLGGTLHYQLARTYSALRRGVRSLLRKYKKVPNEGKVPGEGVVGNQKLPKKSVVGNIPVHPTEGSLLGLRRIGDLEVKAKEALLPSIGCLAFRACCRTVGASAETKWKNVVLKFVRQYGIVAHQHAADNNVAPQLVQYTQGLPGGWEAVVMEDIGKQYRPFRAEADVPVVREAVLAAYRRVFEAADLVHGDLRPNNIMVQGEGATQAADVKVGYSIGLGLNPSIHIPKVAFLDFDWAGKEGEVWYPTTINLAVTWAKGVEGGVLITKEHDFFQLGETEN